MDRRLHPGLPAVLPAALGQRARLYKSIYVFVLNVPELTSLYGSQCARLPLNNNPVENVSGNSIRCNAGTSPVSRKCPVSAGDTVTVEMHEVHVQNLLKVGDGSLTQYPAKRTARLRQGGYRWQALRSCHGLHVQGQRCEHSRRLFRLVQGLRGRLGEEPCRYGRR